MSTFADTLPEDQRPAYWAAVNEAGRLLAAALTDQAELARTGGPRAVAEAAYRPGGPAVSEIEARYLQLLKATREWTRMPPSSSSD